MLCGRNRSALVLVCHHVIVDAHSLGILLREVAAGYAGLEADPPGCKAARASDPFDAYERARGRLEDGAAERDRQYWCAALGRLPARLTPPTDHPRAPVLRYTGSHHRFEIDADLRAAVERLARAHGATPFMVLLATFQLLLARWTEQWALCVATPVSLRECDEDASAVGYFVNSVLLSERLEPEEPFAELLARVRETCVGAFEHRALPFEALTAELPPEATPLQVLFGLNPEVITPSFGDARVELTDIDSGGVGYELELTLTPVDSILQARLAFSDELYERETIESLAQAYLALLGRAVVAPSTRLRELPLIDSPVEAIRAGLGPRRVWPGPATFHERFEQLAALHPSTIAATHAERVAELRRAQSASQPRRSRAAPPRPRDRRRRCRAARARAGLPLCDHRGVQGGRRLPAAADHRDRWREPSAISAAARPGC